MGAKQKKPSYLNSLFSQLMQSEQGQLATVDAIGNALGESQGVDFETLPADAIKSFLEKNDEQYGNILTKMQKHPFATKLPIAPDSKVTVSPLKTAGSALWRNVKDHRGMAALTGGLTIGNIAGLTDNDNVLGQIGGTVGGALLGSKLLELTPYGTLNAALVGGGLGALFDKLREKGAQEEQYQQQYV